MNQQLSTPFYTKTDKNMPWPKDKMFYLMTRDGLFICRNHEWFSSCAPAKKGPSELEDQKPFIDLKYPMVPRALIERALGFFHLVFKDRKAESALILVWNRQTGKMELVCPKQKVSWGSVKYDIPDLPPHLALIGDIHSHCDFAPKASYTDEGDEINRPGLHIVAGYIDKEPPEFYCAVMADGQRFEVDDIKDVVEDYQ
jgi:PRTRC genetic system protein A